MFCIKFLYSALTKYLNLKYFMNGNKYLIIEQKIFLILNYSNERKQNLYFSRCNERRKIAIQR